MSDPIHNKLANALQRATEVSRKHVIRSSSLRRGDRELLTERGYLQEILRGWYLLGRPIDEAGDSTAWYGAFWDFLCVYLEGRFGGDYCLSASSSIDVHIGANVIPQQVIAVTARGGAMRLQLPHNTSVLVYPDEKNIPRTVEVVQGLRTMPLALALCRLPPVFFERQPLNAEIALRAMKSIDDLVRVILESESASALAARFAGAYEFLGDQDRVAQITRTLDAAGIAVSPKNPFTGEAPRLADLKRLTSPYAGRIEALFRTLREPVLEAFKDIPPRPVTDADLYIHHLESVYEHDAYNSLSIEGYRVTHELIEKIRSGEWNPDGDPKDREQVAGMAAKGYLEAFRLVKLSVANVLSGQNAGAVLRENYRDWYRALFSESVRAGILESHHLAGHRSAPVYIRGSRHVPPPAEAVNDSLSTLLDLLENEKSPIVRAVLGHWLFGFIHPYIDGNGRLARFLMNIMMASGGYPWTIVRNTRRKAYLDGLESASSEQNIVPFATFIREEMSVDWSNEPLRK
jgi:hypothetical protein